MTENRDVVNDLDVLLDEEIPSRLTDQAAAWTAKAYAGVVAAGLESSSPDDRLYACQILGDLNYGVVADHAGRLTPLLDDTDARVRSGAVTALGSCGPEVAGFHNEIAALLGDAPLRPGPHHPEAWGPRAQTPSRQWPVNSRVLSGDSEHTVRHAAAATLKDMGPSIVMTHSHELGACLHDESAEVVIAALNAVVSLGAQAALFAADTASLLRHRHPDVRSAASDALQAMGEAGAVHAAARLSDRESYVCIAAAETLQRMSKLGAKHAAGLLQVQDPSSIRVVIQTLAPMGVEGANAVLELMKEHGTDHVKMGAILTLGSLGAAGAACSKDLAALLWDKNSCVRDAAVNALGKLSAGADDVIKVLCSANSLRDPTGDVRKSAVRALSMLGNAGAEKACALLKSWDKYIRCAAAEIFALRRQAEPHEAAALANLLADPEFCVRNAMILALQRLGITGATAVAPHLGATHILYRHGALQVLCFVGAQGAEHAEAVLGCLADSDGRVRAAATETLGAFGNQSPSIINAISARLSDGDPAVRRAACRGLANLLGDSASAEHAATIAKLLEDATCVGSAAEALGWLGKAGVMHVGDLGKLLEHGDVKRRLPAVVSLGRLAKFAPVEKQHARRVAELLQTDPDDDVRLAAAEVLGPMHPAEVAPYAVVLKAACSSDGSVLTTSSIRSKAATSLGLLGDAESLIELLSDQLPGVRASAAEALTSIKPTPPMCIASLEPLMKDEDVTVRNAAIEALTKILGPGLQRPQTSMA
eukprot:gnl/MRDRNA2_/MRDRNA2_30325_c0_seq1.p1 gnl/MRDRNA2_/MRDRNA2_30325_c0~~gnl/MRDRNA2_/MRDRNA2_30325_c0_seq1.p1  ORF type:complete len:839 (+),score=178.60 gnl/MRDRNA2_/MRDRNA2_30325_c0_seq1:228-2519(+)